MCIYVRIYTVDTCIYLRHMCIYIPLKSASVPSLYPLHPCPVRTRPRPAATPQTVLIEMILCILESVDAKQVRIYMYSI